MTALTILNNNLCIAIKNELIRYNNKNHIVNTSTGQEILPIFNRDGMKIHLNLQNAVVSAPSVEIACHIVAYHSVHWYSCWLIFYCFIASPLVICWCFFLSVFCCSVIWHSLIDHGTCEKVNFSNRGPHHCSCYLI